MADVAIDPENKNPQELLGQGIKAFVLQDYESAVTALSKASELLVAENGSDVHESLGEVYLYYGKALLGLAREESQPLGDAVPKDEENDESDEEAAESGETDGEGEDPEKKEEGEDAATNGENTTKSTEDGKKDEESTDPSAENEPTTSTEKTENGSGQEADEEPSDLQVAWEVLELAKKIYENQGDGFKKQLAETLITLGQVSLESENFASGVNDIKDGLQIQKDLYSDDSRTVAETYYNLGIAYSLNSQIDEAIESLRKSIEYLTTRMNKLKTESEKHTEEIREIEQLLPEVEEKITDMQNLKDETIKKIAEAVSKPANSSNDSSSSSSKPATDISHLVKRKRKLDDIAEEKEDDTLPSKKVAK